MLLEHSPYRDSETEIRFQTLSGEEETISLGAGIKAVRDFIEGKGFHPDFEHTSFIRDSINERVMCAQILYKNPESPEIIISENTFRDRGVYDGMTWLLFLKSSSGLDESKITAPELRLL